MRSLGRRRIESSFHPTWRNGATSRCVRAALASSAAAVALGPTPAAAATIDAGALRAEVADAPWGLRFTDTRGGRVLEERSGGSATSPAGALGFERGGVWHHATRVLTTTPRNAGAYGATLATDDPAGGTLTVTVSRAADGIVRVAATGPAGATRMGVGFQPQAGERFLGFGERSDAVVRAGGTVEHRVTEGPYQPVESPFLAAFVPPPGQNTRADATYFPIPWLLSSRGYGVLIEEDEVSRHTLDGAWSMDVDGRSLRYKVYAGPRPADALARFSQDVGRQPPAEAPFFFGPWWQPQNGKEQQGIDALRKAGAIGSVLQTYTHYLPCADQLPNPPGEKERTERAHAAGLAITTYFNPMICTTYPKRYAEARDRKLLTQTQDGAPYEYRYTGSAQFFVGQLDFTAPGATSFFGDLLQEAVDDGYDGWMEDFGEYTPLDSKAHDGTPGSAMHNRYVTEYHRAGRTFARDRAKKPLARFNRSGWTGAAKESQIVWGGDPSTSFGFDGLQSSIRNGLSMGLSGVSLWGSDIGGFFALSTPQTTPELMRRWLQAGFAQGVMRTQGNGFDLNDAKRAQIFDADVLPTWTRYARLRTQLFPYLDAAQRTYDATGLPIMRHLALTHPDDPKAVAREDVYGFGPDLLAAPVTAAGATSKRVYLPEGRWIDLWRSADVRPDGSLALKAPVVLEGGREHTIPAPADELPLLVRQGAVIPLLPADVQTLTSYGKGVVRLADRDRRRTLLAWPKRGGSGEARATPRARVRSGLGAGSRWALRVQQEKRRRFDLQVALPKKPCALVLKGRRQPYTYADGVLRASVRMGSGTLVARTRCR